MCESMSRDGRVPVRGLVVVTILTVLMGCKGEVATEVEAEPTPAAAPERARVDPPATPPDPPPRDDAVPELPRTPTSSEELAQAASQIHANHRRTFYCGCAYTPADRVARGTCGYETRADESLSKRVVWDRIVPVQLYGPRRACWAASSCESAEGKVLSGIECCLQRDPVFRAMYNDLHNVVPAIAEIAQDRAGLAFGEIEGEARMYGACDFEVDHSSSIVEPSESIRGKIARAYLYMHARYGDALELEDDEQARFRRWHAENPADAWEGERNAAITSIQGHPNPFVDADPPAGQVDAAGAVAGGRLESMLRGESESDSAE